MACICIGLNVLNIKYMGDGNSYVADFYYLCKS